MRGEIVFQDVQFGYDGQPVLKGISFRAQPGETIAIVGQTGSGKTTLTRLINRIYDTTEGRVLIDGVDVREWNIASLRSQISTIEQDIFLFARSIEENIAFGVGQEVTRDEIERVAREAQAHEFITGFDKGYDTVVGERGVTLSGGQKQRVAIARALLLNPRILILDDSTSSVDMETEYRIQQALDRLMEGRTSFVIAQRIATVLNADQILVLDGGKIVAQGVHEELMRDSEIYADIYNSQLLGDTDVGDVAHEHRERVRGKPVEEVA